MKRIPFVNAVSDGEKAGYPLAGHGFAAEGDKPAFAAGQAVCPNQHGG
ncbi:MAG: hypothetical protein GXY80_07340 [Syntrophorhabdus aromaticivorans]|uniref:Uncharacterized protein n=1 Tax=Syntrophorhabdus aromaticivorans TaxID=328301 RepID=A0A971M442_9BACT|nr:hypothetical protein [Syntrophorhabdus aromaticivorans]